MPKLQPPKRMGDSQTEEKEILFRVPIKMPAALIARMKDYHKPKEKSVWVAEAILDLLDRDVYRDATWDKANEDTEVFMAFLTLNERLVDPQADVYQLPKNAYDRLKMATENITKLYPDLHSRARPAIIRAAVRQRLLLKGNLFSNALYDG